MPLIAKKSARRADPARARWRGEPGRSAARRCGVVHSGSGSTPAGGGRQIDGAGLEQPHVRRRHGSGFAARRRAATRSGSCAAAPAPPTSGWRDGRPAVRNGAAAPPSPGSSKLQPTISCRPRVGGARLCARRRSRWRAVNRPKAPWRAGNVAGSRSITLQTRHLLNQVHLTRDVRAAEGREGSRRGRPARAAAREPERAQDLGGARLGDIEHRAARTGGRWRSRNVTGSGPAPPMSTVPGRTLAPHRSIINRVATA